MNFVQRFTFLFSAPTFEAEDLEGFRVAEIITAIQRIWLIMKLSAGYGK